MPAPLVETRYWQQADECLPRGELQARQLERLRAVVGRVAGVPFYRERFAAGGLTPEAIREPGDLRRLPFTTKADLRDAYPLGFLTCERARLVRYHGSSGTTGRPTFVAYTRADLDLWADLCARVLVAGGLRPAHTVQVAFGYGLFTGGFGLHGGIERVGAGVVPAGSGNTERQLMLMEDLQTDVLIGTPSYALHLAETIRARGLDRGRLALRYAHLGGEPWTEDMRARLEADLDILCFNNYGLSEVLGPGVSGECGYRCGMHIAEDHFIVECLDPRTLEPVSPGEPGELVFTALTKEAFPLLRYRTRDIAVLDPAPCPCGRTGVRMSRVTGRTDDMLIIRGVNVFPSQIEEALLRVSGTAPHYQIILERPGALDEAVVRVEVAPAAFSDRMDEMTALRDRVGRAVHGITGLHMRVELAAPGTLERFTGKASRVVDRRGG